MLNKPQEWFPPPRTGALPDRDPADHRGAAGDLFPVGRLDIDTEGLLLLTNDGALAHNLLSPRKHVDKVYFAALREASGDAVGRRQPAWCWRTARKPFRPVWKS